MGKTADRYCEGALKASGSLVTKRFQVSSFFGTNEQKTLKMFTKIAKIPPNL